jgi:peptidoglycan/xylan/chitin deacetylase (PgdA/CDA1 family)
MRRLASGGVILCYHSLTDRAWPSASLVSVPRDRFEAQVELLRRLAQIVPLPSLLEEHAAGRDTRGLVALTFDDAYASLLPSAPFLRTERVPITVFVVAEAAEAGANFWWDRVEDLFPRVSPDRWQRFEKEVGLPDEYRRGQPPDYGPLRPLRQWILAAYGGRWPAGLSDTLAALESEVQFRTVQRAMTWDELREFCAGTPVDVGVHTLTHPVLPLLSEEEFLREVRGAWEAVRARIGRALPVLAIPYGLHDEQTAPRARAAGMVASLSLAPRPLRRRETASLPRYCLTFREPHWKLVLRLTGLAEVVRGRGRGGESYPALPSPTT